MNKIPQFKVWNKATKKFLEEREGQEILINSKNQVFVNDEIFGYGLREIKDVVICRFTGLVDVTNKPIYENDIIGNLSGWHQKVVYGIGEWALQNKIGFIIKPCGKVMVLKEISNIEHIIGNIFENPDLLEE